MSEVRKVWGIKYPHYTGYSKFDQWVVRYKRPYTEAPELDSLNRAFAWLTHQDADHFMRTFGNGFIPSGLMIPEITPFYIHPDGSRTEHPPTVSNVPPNYTFAGYTDFGAVQVPRYEDMEHSGKRLMNAWWQLADTAASMLPKPTSKSRQIALAHDILDMLQ